MAQVLPFFSRKDVLRVEDALCGAVGLLVPPLRYEQVMKDLHDTHPGITLMMALARSLVWWPNIDADPERMVHFCILGSWEYIQVPLIYRLHLHYAGPLSGTMYLIVVDAFSKWVKVAITHIASSEATIES